MIKITHQGVYQVYKDRLFDNVNSYSELNKAISKWVKKPKDGEDDNEYRQKTGIAYEIFAQFFAIECGATPLLGITNIKDTSTEPFNPGYDFVYQDMYNNTGLIQVKWRDNPLHQFPNYSFSTFNEQADALDVLPTNRILFINFDNHTNLFDYKYDAVRKRIRIIDRKAQEEFINRDPNFWSKLRKCIEYSAKNYFKDKYKLRDVQEWILNGNPERGYVGTQAVINGLIPKGRVEASTATGKSLCIQENIETVLANKRDIVLVTIPWRSLISQSFNDYYTHKLFGWEDANGVIHDTNTSCIIIMSGEGVRYNNTIADVFQSLNPEEITGKILSLLALGRKVVILTTMASYDKWYTNEQDNGILNKLLNKGIKQDQIFEIIDEYHNLIPSAGKRLEHLKTAEFLVNYSNRNSGTIFYSASNKTGEVVSSFNEQQFGPLLAKVTRNDLYERGYVCPGLEFKIIRVNNKFAYSDDKRELEKKGIDLNKAQVEASAIVKAFIDLKNHYTEPNLITFGSHVAGCKFIASDSNLQEILGDIKMHFMSADTKSSDRELSIDKIKKSGNNILNQHSVAKEGVNIPNLHAGLIDRSMDFKTAQQAIGRSDRALYEDTCNLLQGKLSLDNPLGWKKYWNVIYVVLADDDDTFVHRMKDLVRYLKTNGIPREKWSFSFVEDEERTNPNGETDNFYPDYGHNISFDKDKLNKIIEEADILVEQDLQSEISTMNNIFNVDYSQEIANIEQEDWLSSLTDEEYMDYIVKLAQDEI